MLIFRTDDWLGKVLIRLMPAFLVTLVFFSCTTVSGIDDLAKEYFSIGKDFELAKDTEKAAAYYQKALALKPDFRMARFNLSQIMLAKGQFDQALELLTVLRREDPENQSVHEALAFLAAKNGQYRQAWTEYLAIHEKVTGRVSVLYNLVLLGGELNELAASLAYAQELAELRPAEARYAELAAQAALSSGNEELADLYLAKFLELSQSRPDAILELVSYLENKEQTARALALLDSLLAIDPKNGKAWFEKAVVLSTSSPADANEALAVAIDSGFSDQSKLRSLLMKADQGQQALLLETVQKKITDFTLSAPMPKGKKIPGRIILPGET